MFEQYSMVRYGESILVVAFKFRFLQGPLSAGFGLLSPSAMADHAWTPKNLAKFPSQIPEQNKP